MRRSLSPDGLAGRLAWHLIRGSVRVFLFRWVRLRHEGVERLRVEGRVIFAPVHRSNIDGPIVGSLSHRRVRYLSKDSLFSPAAAGWVMRSVGCFPVKRGSADLDAMRAGKKLLDSGDAMLVFPEGTRQSGDEIAEIFDGAAWLAAKSQALVVPVGIAGSEAAMPSGSKGIKRVPVAIVVGDPMSPPGSAGQRASRAELKAWTAELRTVLMELQERAEVLNQR